MYYGERKKRAYRPKRKEDKGIGGLRGRRGDPMRYFLSTPNREIKKIPVPEQAFEFMKNINPQQLVDFLLPNGDDWHVKTSSASGN